MNKITGEEAMATDGKKDAEQILKELCEKQAQFA